MVLDPVEPEPDIVPVLLEGLAPIELLEDELWLFLVFFLVAPDLAWVDFELDMPGSDIDPEDIEPELDGAPIWDEPLPICGDSVVEPVLVEPIEPEVD